MKRLPDTDNSSIRIIDDSITIHILVFRVARSDILADTEIRNTVLEKRSVGKLIIFVCSHITVAIHEACRHAHLRHIRSLGAVAGIPVDCRYERCLIVGKCRDSIVVHTEIQCRCPGKVLCLDRYCRD